MSLFHVSLMSPRCRESQSCWRPWLEVRAALNLQQGVSEQGTSASTHLSLVIRAQGGVLKYNPITVHPHPLDATMTSSQSAFHLRELPSGGQQTSPELLRVCSSHPCRAVSLTQVWFIIAPSLSCWNLQPSAWKLKIMTLIHYRVPVCGPQVVAA